MPAVAVQSTSDSDADASGAAGADQAGGERRTALEDRRRDDVADIAHDLKAPLSIAAALLERIRANDDLPAPARSDAEAAARQLATMAALLAELLNPERSLSRGVGLDERECDVAALVRSVVEGFEPIGAARHIDVRCEGPPALPSRADPLRLERVIANLVANALRFAPFGGTVRVTVAACPGGVRLEVADDGPGIPEGERERVFDRHHGGRRVPRGADSGRTGTGIGLATARTIVELHRGTVHADRAPEGGALFVVELPLPAPHEQT